MTVMYVNIDGYTFKCHISHYCPEIPGTFRWDEASDWDYQGYPAVVDFECYAVSVDGVDIPEKDAIIVFSNYEVLVEEKILENLSKVEEDYETY